MEARRSHEQCVVVIQRNQFPRKGPPHLVSDEWCRADLCYNQKLHDAYIGYIYINNIGT